VQRIEDALESATARPVAWVYAGPDFAELAHQM
jgi:hypothetical protein